MIEQYRVGEKLEAKNSRIFFFPKLDSVIILLLLQLFSEIFFSFSEAELSKGWRGHAAQSRNHCCLGRWHPEGLVVWALSTGVDWALAANVSSRNGWCICALVEILDEVQWGWGVRVGFPLPRAQCFPSVKCIWTPPTSVSVAYWFPCLCASYQWVASDGEKMKQYWKHF